MDNDCKKDVISDAKGDIKLLTGKQQKLRKVLNRDHRVIKKEIDNF